MPWRPHARRAPSVSAPCGQVGGADVTSRPIHVVGAGLAGPEAAVQIARRGLPVLLHEMRPSKRTPAHETDEIGELVCSNSLKTETPGSAPGLLKEELRRMGSVSMRVAAEARIPGGTALTVDRRAFSRGLAAAVGREPLIRLERGEVTRIPLDSDEIWIVATGPLTSDALAEFLVGVTGRERLFFHDAISPIVDAETIDMSVAYRASRYGNSLDGSDDYVNCPMDREQYDRFVSALLAARQHQSHEFDNPNYFEGCLPIEELARRGANTLRFGPMKPVGLRNPQTGESSYAVVQLRQEDARAGSYNIVGFQNHLKYGEQKRLLRMIPGLEHAEFLRYGQIHRNTYINAPALLRPTLQWKQHPNVLFAGQISGVEGYVESMATGLIAGWNAARLARSQPALVWPRETAHGSLCTYISGASATNYQPANITFDLLPPAPVELRRKYRRRKRERRKKQCELGLSALKGFLDADRAAA